MAYLHSLKGYKKDELINWGICKPESKRAGKPWASYAAIWQLDSKKAAEILKREDTTVYSGSQYLELTDDAGIDLFNSLPLADLLVKVLHGVEDGASKNEAGLYTFGSLVTDVMYKGLDETFEVAEGKDAPPITVQIAAKQLRNFSEALASWQCKANVHIIQVSSGNSDDKRNQVKTVQVWEQLDD